MQRYDWIHTFTVRDLGYTPTMNEMVKTAKTILPDYLLYVKPEYMENILRYLRNKYETVEDYLLSKGISKTEIYKLKSKLLD